MTAGYSDDETLVLNLKMILVNIFVHSPLFCVLILYLFEIESQKWSDGVQGMHACWGGMYVGGFLPGHLDVGET